MIDAVSVLSVGPEATDGVALDHEAEEDGHATGEDDGSDNGNASSKLAHDEDAPVEEKDPDLDDSYPERPEHHENVEILDWSILATWQVRKGVEEVRFGSSDIPKFLSAHDEPQNHLLHLWPRWLVSSVITFDSILTDVVKYTHSTADKLVRY